MQKNKNHGAFEHLGADIKEARQASKLSRKLFAEMVNVVPRYLADIENSGFVPTPPLLYELAQILKLPITRYFYPVLGIRDTSGIYKGNGLSSRKIWQGKGPGLYRPAKAASASIAHSGIKMQIS